MSELQKLISFIPVLDTEGLGEWNAIVRSDIGSTPAPSVEYWEVVHRFSDTVLDLADMHPELLTDDTEQGEIFGKIFRLVSAEEECPGIILGSLSSGVMLDLLKKLKATGC